MRASPHALLHNQSRDFAEAARDVLSDGVTTHGHPRALVGALAYAFTIWRSLKLSETLSYGGLLEAVLDGVGEWGVLPDITDRWEDWIEAANLEIDYHRLWQEAVREQVTQLNVARRGVSAGALSVDRETLEEIGAFDRGIGGAGTIAASAAIYLASKYAASPLEGVTVAALSRGADTDTIAAMTGAIAGSINGTRWLDGRSGDLQDRSLFTDLAENAARVGPSSGGDAEVANVDQRVIRHLIEGLANGETKVVLPNGQKADVVGPADIRGKGSVRIDSWKLVDEWSQTIIVRRQRRNTKSAPTIGVESENTLFPQQDKSAPSQFVGLRLVTHSLQDTTSFYVDYLGLPLGDTTQGLQRVGSYFAFREDKSAKEIGQGTTLYIEVGDIRSKWDRLRLRYPHTVSPIKEQAGRSRFHCLDPDHRLIEVFELRQ